MSELAAKIRFIFNSGKNPKWKYYLMSAIREAWPKGRLRKNLQRLLDEAERRPDFEYLTQRRDYYCRLTEKRPLGPEAVPISALKVQKPKVYYHDTLRYTRWFDPNLKLQLLAGDIVHVPDTPCLVKSRPLADDLACSTLMKLDRVRHFIFVNDRLSWSEKRPMAIFRGKVGGKEARRLFMQHWFGHPLVDAGDVGRNPDKPEWKSRKLTLFEQLQFKFIMAIEGNDVASNLKWIMSSNSIAVMPKPTCETWFMEGKLKPGYHYIEVKPDFSDLEEKINYYLEHPEEAEAIISHAHEWVEQFRDEKREDLISLMVLRKYLDLTN